MKRTLSMLLVLAMLLSCLPMGALATEVETESAETVAETVPETAEVIAETTESTEAAVEETEAAVVETAEVITDAEVIEEPVALASSDSLWQDEWGDWYFSDFEGLKQLAAMSFTDWTPAAYQGEGALVIKETLTLPANLYVNAFDCDITVPAGVTFTAVETLDVANLTIEGAANLSWVNVFESITVTGHVTTDQGIQLWNNAAIAGRENIAFTNEWSSITYSYEAIATAASLKEILALASNSSDRYSIWSCGQITLTEDTTIPGNCDLYLGLAEDTDKMTVANGATLTVEGYMDVTSQLIVNGALANNGTIDLYPSDQAALVVGSTGSYSGNGLIYIGKGNVENYTDAFSGLDLSGFSVSENEWNWELRVVSDDPVQNEWGEWDIYNFASLKEMASKTYTDWTNVNYRGSEPLVISENLSLPENLHLITYDQGVHVPAGITFTTATEFSAGDLTIDGTMNTFGGWIGGSLTVNGKLNIREYLTLEITASLVGYENITFANEWTNIGKSASSIRDVATLKQYLAVAAAETNDRIHYNFHLNESLTITESLTVPANSWIYFQDYGNGCAYTVASGVTLTNNGGVQINAPLTVKGNLVNNAQIAINYSAQGNQGHLTMEGTYSGNGRIGVSSNENIDPKTLFTGFGWNDFEINEEHYGDYHNWDIYYAAGLTKLATPTNLEWGYRRHVWADWDEEKQEPIYTTVAFPGGASWKPVEPTQARADIKFYRVGEDEALDLFYGTEWWFESTYLPEWRSVESFAQSDPESGTYYFTVTSLGDYTQYRNSDPATSPTWTYVKPDAKLGTCTNLSWDWPHASFTYNGDKTYYGGQEFQILFSATENGEPTTYNWSWGYDPSEILTVWDDVMMECGVGYYYFKVRALSSDITKACNGEWSELSPAYNLTEVVEKVENQLNNILQGSENLTDEEVREAVQELDTQKLKDSLLAEDAVQQQIAILEEQVGGPAEVAVSNEVAMNANEISVVGANLNNAASADEDIKLVIDKPEKDHVLDAAFDNSVAFKFSMTLDNVEDAKNLDVPVRITMPVPAGVNPEFLVILHYHVDGSFEEVGPSQYNISGNGDKLFVSFVVTSFSDFVITQTAAAHEHIEAIDAKVDATCTEPGKTEGKHCETCGEVLVAQEEIPAKGHTEVIDAKVEPTCTEPGKTEGKHCSVCNEVLVAQEEIPAIGHKWDNGKVTKEPTATEDGVKTFTCTACGETKEEPVPATGEEILWGDASGDGRVNAMDATRILRYAAKLIKEDKIDLIAADVNSDGRVNAMDATRILRYAAKLITELKVQK